MRLIDADALLDKCEHYGKKATWDNPYGNGGVYGVSYENIENAPTVDPVKHGYWTEEHKCSVCDNEAHVDRYNFQPEYDYDWEENLVETGGIVYDSEYLETDWCPYCGARMDKEVSEC